MFAGVLKDDVSPDVWGEGNEMLVKMRNFHDDFSTRGFKMFGDIKTNLMNSDDTHFSESQTAFETASLMKTLVTALTKVQRSAATKTALNKVLNDGASKLSADLAKLQESAQRIDAVKTKTKALLTELEIQYNTESKASLDKYNKMREVARARSTNTQQRDVMHQLMEKMHAVKRLHDEVANKLSERLQHIDSKKAKLQDEIKSIDHLKSKIDPIKTLLNSDDSSDDDFKKSAQDLIAECDEYRQRYSDTHPN